MAITTVHNELIAENAISGTLIADNAVTAVHIAGTSVTATQIQDNAIGTGQLAGIARGKIIYGDSSGDPQLLTLGSNGQVLKSAEKFGEVVITEVDLNRPLHWTSLGDFKAQLNSHRPVVNGR